MRKVVRVTFHHGLELIYTSLHVLEILEKAEGSAGVVVDLPVSMEVSRVTLEILGGEVGP